MKAYIGVDAGYQGAGKLPDVAGDPHLSKVEFRVAARKSKLAAMAQPDPAAESRKASVQACPKPARTTPKYRHRDRNSASSALHACPKTSWAANPMMMSASLMEIPRAFSMSIESVTVPRRPALQWIAPCLSGHALGCGVLFGLTGV